MVWTILDDALIQSSEIVLDPCLSFDHCHLLQWTDERMTFRKAVLPFLSRGKGMQNATIYFMTKSQQTIPKMYRRQENPKIFLFSLKRERERA